MLTRKMELLSLGGNAQSKSFCPGACSKEDMEKWEAIREASKTRHKKRQMVERLLQKISEEHGSKSLNDVSADELQTIRQMRYEELQKIKTQLREQDQQWQDDLAKWKSRRRSHTSDLQRKKEEREEIERRSSESSERRSKTLREMQRDRERRDQAPLRNSWQETEQMYLSNDDVFREEKASPKVCVPTEANGGLKKEDDHELRNRKPERGAKEEPLASVDSLAGERMESTLPSSQTSNAQTGSGRVSASLSRSYQKADTARLTSVVTPRPFGAPMRGISSLPRSFTMDAVVKYNGGLEGPRAAQSGHSRGSEAQTGGVQGQGKMEPQVAEDSKTRTSHLPEEQRRGTPESEPKSDHHTSSNSMTVSSSAPKEKILSVTEESRRHEQYSDMRISINQKPGSSRNFGFTVSQNPSGVFGEWEAAISRALENGRLVMDVRRHGKKGTPENKCIDATSGDRTSTQSQQMSEKEAHGHVQNDVSETKINGMQDDTSSYERKDTEPISLKNLKRRSQFFEQGGQEPAILDLPVPPIAAPSRWTWDQEEERKRQEKWQAEQERLLQEQYKREQERLKEEWLKAQQEAEKDISSYLKETPTSLWERNGSNRTAYLSSERNWEEESKPENQGKDSELARSSLQQQGLQVEQKRKLPETENGNEWNGQDIVYYSMEPSYPEEVPQKPQVDPVKESRRWEGTSQNLLMDPIKEPKHGEETSQNLLFEPIKEPGYQEETSQKLVLEQLKEPSFWDEVSHKSHIEITKDLRYQEETSPNLLMEPIKEPRYREETSKDLLMEPIKEPRYREEASRDLLMEPIKEPRYREEASQKLLVDPIKEALVQRLQYQRHYESPRLSYEQGKHFNIDRSQKEQGLSAAELERQQILQEMKKRTSLHTDSSWIRQRNSSVHKEPFSLTGTRMRRGESLDNLDSSRTNSWRPHSWMNQSASSTSLSSSQEFGQHIPPVVSTSNRAYMRTPSSSLPSPSSASMKTSSLPHIPPSSSVPQAPSSTSSSQSGTQQRNRSVSGKRMCSSCRNALGKGAAMIIESLGLCYHLHCFKCVACEGDLGGSQAGAEVRIRNNELFCNSCYLRFKTGHTTTM
ncbi:hypothetical protein E2320_004902 [Naja naja]|nr:hypothetical protein E2320_004902 [Naja naja]